MRLRREFLAQLSGLVAASSLDVRKLEAMRSADVSEWDMSWVERITAAKYRAAFNANAIKNGDVVYSAALVLDQFHEVYGTGDQSTCPVIVFRSAGTVMAFNDSLWARYKIGKVVQPRRAAAYASLTESTEFATDPNRSWTAPWACGHLFERRGISRVNGGSFRVGAIPWGNVTTSCRSTAAPASAHAKSVLRNTQQHQMLP